MCIAIKNVSRRQPARYYGFTIFNTIGSALRASNRPAREPCPHEQPFNSNRNYEVFWGETKEKRAFRDRHASTDHVACSTSTD